MIEHLTRLLPTAITPLYTILLNGAPSTPQPRYIDRSRRASLKAVVHVVALFVKGITIHCKVRLVANRFLTRCIHQYNVIGVLVRRKQYNLHKYSELVDALIILVSLIP